MTTKKQNPYVNPYADKQMIGHTEEFLRDKFSEEQVDLFLAPVEHPDLPGYLLPNSGQDATPIRVEVLYGYIHEPDGTVRGQGDVMVLPKYIADPWIETKRVKRLKS